jgi:hypothetical protein
MAAVSLRTPEHYGSGFRSFAETGMNARRRSRVMRRN